MSDTQRSEIQLQDHSAQEVRAAQKGAKDKAALCTQLQAQLDQLRQDMQADRLDAQQLWRGRDNAKKKNSIKGNCTKATSSKPWSCITAVCTAGKADWPHMGRLSMEERQWLQDANNLQACTDEPERRQLNYI
ncbi:TPA: hypothetical protein ACH3X2_013595 [Trebouxia sp. C0005]